jgi:hypothetical protein
MDEIRQPEHQKLHDDLLRTRHQLVAHADTTMRRVIIVPPGARPPFGAVEPSDTPTLAIVHRRLAPHLFSSAAELCLDLFRRLNAAVSAELQELFGDIGPVTPFDLLTGEERPTDTRHGKVISYGPLPGLEDDDRLGR